MDETEKFPKVQGHCMYCSHESLFLGEGGFVTCSRADCKSPTATNDFLCRGNNVMATVMKVKNTEEGFAGKQTAVGPLIETENVELKPLFRGDRSKPRITGVSLVEEMGKSSIGETFVVSVQPWVQPVVDD